MKFLCEYKLQMYPFDSQICFAKIEVDSSQILFVDLVIGRFLYKGPNDLTQYSVKKTKMSRKQLLDGKVQIEIEISLGRKLMNSVLTIYLPTVLLICIIHATNYFKDFFFEATVTVNLTGMLVLTTIFLSVSGNLPQTSYVKMVDIWLLFCILVPFCEVLLHTWMDSNRGESREVNSHGKTREVGNGETDSNIIKVSPGPNTRPGGLVDRKENVQVDALRKFYSEANLNKKNVKFGEFLGRKAIPSFIMGFAVLYWLIGLRHYNK